MLVTEDTCLPWSDLRKAFDTVDRQILLKKMTSFNLGDGFIAWLREYLTNRKQQTKAMISNPNPTSGTNQHTMKVR